VKAEIGRQHLRAETLDEANYIASLGLVCTCERLAPSSPRLQRVEELFQRTTQFNTTGRKFSTGELMQIAGRTDACLLALDVSDRFGDYGLVGAAVIVEGEVVQLAMSCRALGMGVEHTFMRHVLDAARQQGSVVRGRIIASARNIPVRHLFRDNGFAETEPGLWEYRFQAVA
jgi:FkbH-like protein